MQPETGFLHPMQQRHIRATRQRGFKGKIGAGFRELRNALQNGAPGTQQPGVRIKRRVGAGNQVGVNEIGAPRVEWKKLGGKGRFPRTVWSGDDVADGGGRFAGHCL